METYFDYLREFAPELGTRIVEMYPALQGPKDPVAPQLKTLLRRPLPAQAMTATGCAKYLKDAKSVRVIGECGTGKTLITLAIAHAHAEGRPYSGIVMCPPHLVLKWAREILITIPRAQTFVIYDFRNGGDRSKPHGIVEVRLRNGHVIHQGLQTSLAEIRMMSRRRWKEHHPVPTFFIVSREGGKLGYFWEHVFLEGQPGTKRHGIRNPDTCRMIPRPDHGYRTREDFDAIKLSEDLQHEKGGTSFHSALWQANRDKIQRMAPLEYIGRYMRNWFDYAIADELHQLANDTAQGANLDVLRRCSKKLIGDTGTLSDGYAANLFHILYRMEPRRMVEEGFEPNSHGESEFQAQYGVLESIERISNSDNACSRASKSTLRLTRRPGASPLLFGKFLMATTAFVSLEDIADFLPPYEETVIQVEMDKELAEAYQKIQQEIRQALSENRGNKSLASLMMHRLLLYPDHPFGMEEIWGKKFDPQIKRHVPFLVTKAPDLDREVVYAKEKQLIDDIREELKKGRRCQIYATFTGQHDVPQRLEYVLRKAGFRVAVLRSTVPALRREQWYEKQIKDGVEVVICHPKIVETGLDLLWFPTLYFYELGWSLHTLRQASRRSWRIGQYLDVEVKFFVYKASTQMTCLRLMGRKMLVALMLEGKLMGEGIHSMDADEDMVAAMARELVEKGGVGESAEAIWGELKRERAAQLAAAPRPDPATDDNAWTPQSEMRGLFGRLPAIPPAVHPKPPSEKAQTRPDPLWPTAVIVGEQLRLFN